MVLFEYLNSMRHKIVHSVVGVVAALSCVAASADVSTVSPTLLERVLAKADTAYIAKRYTQPKHNNAYDRYRAVLMIDPLNERASRGLEQIEGVYVALIEGELEHGSAQTAKYYIGIMGEYFPESASLPNLKKKVSVVQPVILKQDANDLLIKSYSLSGKDLAARNAEAKKFVGQIAQRVEKTKEAVLILARNDAEGRWIYQVMNEATPTYRVRGDIELRKTPAIHLLEPL